jgi:NAD(P)-dependent dehydrogenase (short-subunit alcohol dehydrogenase family)
MPFMTATMAALLVWTTIISPAQAAETRALIVAGLGGQDDYQVEFQRHAKRLSDRLSEVGDDVTLLSADTADQATVQTTLDNLIRRTNSADTLVFIFLGHGTFNGEAFKFNVKGPDFTATQLAAWLEPAVAEHQLVVVTGASSGAVQQVLEQDGRTVISGTRSGEQRNATVFGRFFSAALEDEAADVDKDQRITALEAFQFAESGIDDYYSRNNEMTTENPIASGPDPVMVLAHLETQPTFAPGQSHLLTERETLELDIAGLRARKSDYSQEDYYAELQRLLLELAVLEAQIEAQTASEQSSRNAEETL